MSSLLVLKELKTSNFIFCTTLQIDALESTGDIVKGYLHIRAVDGRNREIVDDLGREFRFKCYHPLSKQTFFLALYSMGRRTKHRPWCTISRNTDGESDSYRVATGNLGDMSSALMLLAILTNEVLLACRLCAAHSEVLSTYLPNMSFTWFSHHVCNGAADISAYCNLMSK